MITLINLVKSGSIVKTNYFSETNDNDKGYIEYDIGQKKVINCSYSLEDSKSSIKLSFNKAIQAIERLVEYNKFPKKYRYLWYLYAETDKKAVE